MGSRGVLSQRQKEILVGTLLGDAHLELTGRYSRLRVDHQNAQKDYVLWKAKELEPFSLTPREISETDRRSGKTYKRWHFSTRSLLIFTEFRNLFYVNRKKVIPKNIEKVMTSLSLAVWFMDDGFRRRDSKGFYLCTSSFTSREQGVLQKMLLDRFGLETKIHHQRKLERIFVPSAFADKFNAVVKPFIHPVFRYKLL